MRCHCHNLLQALVFGLVALFIAHLPTSASAAESTTSPFVGEVFVSPLIFVDERDERSVKLAREAMRDGAERFLRTQTTHFRVISNDALVQHISSRPTYADSVSIGRSWAEIGAEHYKRLETAEAITALEKAITIFRGIHYELVEPEAFAEVLQTLVLSHLEERRDVVRPLELLQLMMNLDPARVFRDGYFPEDVVRSYESARQTLQRDIQNNGPDARLARKIGELAAADFVVSMSATRKGETYVVGMHVFSQRDGRFLQPESVTVSVLTPAALNEATSRLMSRMSTCLIEPEPITAKPVEASTGESPWAMELNFAYASFLDFPEPAVNTFGNVGASFGASFLLTREFALLANVQILTSTRDSDGFLTDDFTTLRGFGGISLGYTFGMIRAEMASLLEVTTIGDIEVCKDISAIIVGCPDDRVLYEYNALVGINARPRVSLKLLKSLNLSMGGSLSFFFYPLSERTLNFPVTIETGLQYRF